MLVAAFAAGPWQTNCYVLAPGPGQECVVIDPGMDAVGGVNELLSEHRLRPVAVLLTHGHVDHMWSVVPVADGYGIPALVHRADRHLLADPAAGISEQSREAIARMVGSEGFAEPAEVREIGDGLDLELAGLTLRVDHAPGHTPGSVTFRRAGSPDEPPLLVSGDVLFAGSIGRTDLPGGDTDAMMRSLARVVLPLEDDTVVLPGHGETTTVGRERAVNPYLRALLDAGDAPPTVTRGL